VSASLPAARHAEASAIGDQRVGTLDLAVCMLDRVGQQGALSRRGRPTILRHVS